MSLPDEAMKLKDGKIIYDQLASMVAVQYAEAESNPAGSYVIYNGSVYLLPNGHTANTSWANTEKEGPTNIGEKLSSQLTEINSIDEAYRIEETQNIPLEWYPVNHTWDKRGTSSTPMEANGYQCAYAIAVNPGEMYDLKYVFQISSDYRYGYFIYKQDFSSYVEAAPKVSATGEYDYTITVPADGAWLCINCNADTAVRKDKTELHKVSVSYPIMEDVLEEIESIGEELSTVEETAYNGIEGLENLNNIVKLVKKTIPVSGSQTRHIFDINNLSLNAIELRLFDAIPAGIVKLIIDLQDNTTKYERFEDGKICEYSSPIVKIEVYAESTVSAVNLNGAILKYESGGNADINGLKKINNVIGIVEADIPASETYTRHIFDLTDVNLEAIQTRVFSEQETGIVVIAVTLDNDETRYARFENGKLYQYEYPIVAVEVLANPHEDDIHFDGVLFEYSSTNNGNIDVDGLKKLDDVLGFVNTVIPASNTYYRHILDIKDINIRGLRVKSFIKNQPSGVMVVRMLLENEQVIYKRFEAEHAYFYDSNIVEIEVYANPNQTDFNFYGALFEYKPDEVKSTVDPYGIMLSALSLSSGISQSDIANGTSKYDDIRLGSSNSQMHQEACSIIYNLRRGSYEKRIPYGYFNDWEQVDYYMNNSAYYRKEVSGEWVPKDINEIDLTDLTLAQTAGGPAPSMVLLDFFKFIGLDNYANNDKNEASTIAIVKKLWAENKVLPMFSWHAENPYAPIDYIAGGMKCRYSSEEHPNVVSEILNNTGSACCFNADYPNGQYSNPKAWFDARLTEVANAIKLFVDENGNQIPILLRLWHELEDDWAWWQIGRGVSPAEYKQFFAYTVQQLNTLVGTNKIIIVFCADSNLINSQVTQYSTIWEALSELCPVNNVDVVAYDDYTIGNADFDFSLNYARDITEFAENHGKIAAIAETGFGTDKITHWEHLYRLFTSPGVRLGYINEWVTTGTWIPGNTNEVKNAYAKMLKRNCFYNIGTLPDMTEIGT